ncbi:DUF86 domain-containing protein [bacterium]|nr:DUF86 domain-containing protein [bacterium]
MEWGVGYSIDALQKDQRTRKAILMNFIIIGETARRLVDEFDFQAQHPEIHWSKVVGFRNVIAHQYDELKDERILNLLSEDLPDLIRKVEVIMTELNADGSWQ